MIDPPSPAWASLSPFGLPSAPLIDPSSTSGRMYHTLLGKAGFRKGMDLYFERHDGCAVTCDDFRAAMADANGKDLTQFERWYTQAGTPTVKAAGVYDASKKCYTLT
eukprot:6715122-Prymnesium_polylepis.1